MQLRLLIGLVLGPLAVLGLDACVGDTPIAPGVDASTKEDGAAPDDASHDDAADAASSTDAGVDSGPPPVTRAFISSKRYYGDSIGGLSAADNDCQLLATAASQGTGWKAWLSTSTTNAKDHVPLGSGNIMLVDGITVVVTHGTDLIGDGGLAHAIDHDENKQSVASTLVWTGTTEHGLVYAGSGIPCGDWTAADGGAAAGGSNQVNNAWTSDGLEPCTNSYPIYCFGP